MAKGRFIALEGIDGAGKTTQCAALAEWLRELGHDAVRTREPTDGRWGRRYREWARGGFEASPEEVLEFFVEDRREHVRQVIRPALDAGRWVLCDRYVASTRAYQAAAGVDRESLDRALDDPGTPRPDLTLWLRLPVDRGLARLAGAGRERYEREDFLARVDAEYGRLGLVEIDAGAAVPEVQREIRRRLAERGLVESAGAPGERREPRRRAAALCRGAGEV